MLWGVFALKYSFFQKTIFSRFSIDRTCCSTNRKCDKNLGYNLSGSISARSIEIDFRSIKPNFRPIEIRSEGFLKSFFSNVFFTLFNFSKSFLLSLSLSSTDPPQTFFCRFLPNFSQRILSSSAGMYFLPLLFLFIHIFHDFRCNFQTYWILGFLIFELFSFKLKHWVFVLRWYKHESHALIWLNLCFGKILKF